MHHDSQSAPIEPVPASILPEPTNITYTDYDNPFSLVHDASGSPYIAQLSPNAWVAIGTDAYVLECLGKGTIKIQRVEGDTGMYLIPSQCPLKLIGPQEFTKQSTSQ